MTHPDPRQLLTVRFQRGSSIVPGEPRHPWCWTVETSDGGVFASSEQSFRSIGGAVAHFDCWYAHKLARAENELARMYAITGEPPYDLDQRNPPKEAEP